MRAIVGMLVGLWAGAARAGGDPMELAQAAYVEGHFQQARDLARQALGVKPDLAWRMIGTSSCNLKDRAGAMDALARVGSGDVELLRFVCHKAGVDITDDDAAIWRSPARAQVEQAQAAYAAGKFAEAKKLGLAATVADPKLALGWRVLGAASCWVKDKMTAQKASEHLQPVDQEYVRSVCARAIGFQIKNSRVLK